METLDLILWFESCSLMMAPYDYNRLFDQVITQHSSQGVPVRVRTLSFGVYR